MAAAGIPRLLPKASPRRVVRAGFVALLAGLVLLVALLQEGAGANVTTGPLLLAGLGVGALASQLGSVTVSSVPDEESGEVGGLQNTVTNLGASIGTALAGAVLISALTTTLLTGISSDPAISQSVQDQAQVELSDGVPFTSDADVQKGLEEAGIQGDEAQALLDENEAARIAGLRAALSVLAVLSLVALATSGGIPTTQPATAPTDDQPPSDNEADRETV
jgi:hypothetical protein